MDPIDDLERFTCGDCHFLARAINKLTGWPLCAFSDELGDPDTHAFVIRPDGQALDVQGLASIDEFCERWSDSEIVECDWPLLRRFFLSPLYGDYTYERARIVAKRLVDLYGI